MEKGGGGGGSKNEWAVRWLIYIGKLKRKDFRPEVQRFQQKKDVSVLAHFCEIFHSG